MRLEFTSDWHRTDEIARAFLESSPIRNAVLITLLHARLTRPEPVRCWIAQDSGRTIGLALQSPLNDSALITKVNRRVARMIVQEIHGSGIALPGVLGDAGSAASFAAEWAEVTKVPVLVTRTSRLYEVRRVREPRMPEGRFRQATADDHALATEWAGNFASEGGEEIADVAATVERLITERKIWLWETDVPVSMCVGSAPAAGIVVVQAVYTPSTSRNFGYAGACVATLSQRTLSQNNRCVLYADIANPISNALYRRLGYEPVFEALAFSFGSQHMSHGMDASRHRT